MESLLLILATVVVSHCRVGSIFGTVLGIVPKGLAQAAPGDVESLWEDSGLGGDGHEVGVAEPARKHMKVQVVGDTGSGGLAEVEAEVYAVGVVDVAEDGLNLLCGLHEFAGLGGVEFGERIGVPVGDEQDVAAGIREAVEADEAGFEAGDDEAGSFGGFGETAIVCDSPLDGADEIAEDAVLIGVRPGFELGRNALACLGRGTGDIAVAPGSPEAIHAGQYMVRDATNYPIAESPGL